VKEQLRVDDKVMARRPRRGLLIAVWLFAVYALGCVVGGIALAEMSLHLHRLPLRDSSVYRSQVSQQFHAQVEDVPLLLLMA
jgi:hypothetical protein